MSKSDIVTARELREMKSTTLGEDVVDLSLALHLTMVDIIYSAKDGKGYCYIYGGITTKVIPLKVGMYLIA